MRRQQQRQQQHRRQAHTEHHQPPPQHNPSGRPALEREPEAEAQPQQLGQSQYSESEFLLLALGGWRVGSETVLVGEGAESVGAEVDEGFHVVFREAGGGCVERDVSNLRCVQKRLGVAE